MKDKSIQNRKIPVSISLPYYMATELATHDNASEIIRKLLEENWNRIGARDIEHELSLERQRILEIIEENIEDIAVRVFSKIRMQVHKE